MRSCNNCTKSENCKRKDGVQKTAKRLSKIPMTAKLEVVKNWPKVLGSACNRHRFKFVHCFPMHERKKHNLGMFTQGYTCDCKPAIDMDLNLIMHRDIREQEALDKIMVQSFSSN